ncbi:hypothetical protein [Nesterenkonia aerolata]|uniref:hypothetical protein n=1 Tax=Nesterenkonia aerolata TaxID=3074079 RepID=UPI00286E3456|nr:hypothetical protein [Nesterenkonia sp. LY-0111]
MAQPGDLSLVAVDEHLEGTQIAVLDTADERDVVQRLLSPYVRTGVHGVSLHLTWDVMS